MKMYDGLMVPEITGMDGEDITGETCDDRRQMACEWASGSECLSIGCRSCLFSWRHTDHYRRYETGQPSKEAKQ